MTSKVPYFALWSALAGMMALSAQNRAPAEWRGDKIAAGMDHTFQLRGDGTVWAWGRNSFGQLGDGTLTDRLRPVQVIGLTGVVSIAGGGYHSLALKSDGTVWSWGYGVSGQLGFGSATSNQMTPIQVSGLTGVVAIAGGFEHSLAVKIDGTVWAWGNNTFGQLGDATTTQRLAPVQVAGLTGVTRVSGGGDHSLALKRDGTVWAWGWNLYGQLGDGTTTQRESPVPVSGLAGVTAIACGYFHSLALMTGGTVSAWGQNGFGALGDGSTTDRWAPVTVAGLGAVKAIAGRGQHSLVVKSDGTVWGWGRDDFGQLGDGLSGVNAQHTLAVQASGLTGAVAVVSGYYFGVAMKNDGTVSAWGHNNFGELGDGTLLDRTTPVPGGGLSVVGFARIAAGSLHSLALKNDGTVWAWGLNDFGQLGDGTQTQRVSPVQVSGLTGVSAVSAGDKFSLALKSDGTVWAWGTDAEGQLGDGTTATQRVTPVAVSGLSGVVAIAACHENSLALKSDGTVSAWGYPIVGDGTTLQRLTPVAVSGLTGVMAVACGWEESLALKSDGTVWGWGFNSQGQLGDGTTAFRMTPIAVIGFTGMVAMGGGEGDSLALKSDGTVWGLGRDDWSQLGDGVTVGGGLVTRLAPVQATGLTGVLAISAGYIHTLALKSDGTVWKWGSDSFGSNVAQNPTAVQVNGLAGMVAISGGQNHSLALKSDGTVWAWGRNTEGELGDGTLTNRLAAAVGACTFSVSPTGAPVGFASGTASTAVTATTGCSWTAIANAPWLAVISGTPGSGNGIVGFSFAANPNGTPRSGAITIAGQTFTVTQAGAPVAPGLRFVPVTPCRIADTRGATGAFGGPNLAASVPRDFNVAGTCGVPANALAYSLNLTVVPLGSLGFLSVWPAGQAQPVVSTLNSGDGRIKANAALVPAGLNGAVTLFASNPTHAIVDINGYFVPVAGNNNLQFYPVTPCRIADTRGAAGAYGGPSMASGTARNFTIAGVCGIPATAQAYALNATVVPLGPLGFLSAWPAGQGQPGSSTLNAPTGAVTANAVIVPAGTGGAITLIATNTTDLILDINGYFAPPGAGGMNYYTAAPCRIADTRLAAGPFGGPQLAAASPRSFVVTASTCNIPAGAGSYSLNATVVPPAALGFLSLWGSGGQPSVSTLNAGDASIVANAALVPASLTGSVTAIASHATHLILDINGYFAQ
ncbi:MAG: BACON domain-containing carbohydrate-binding protein [Candidatus Solibacter sp.]